MAMMTGTAPATISLTPGTPATVLFVRRVTAGQASTVGLVLSDRCGDGRTLVGGGPTSF